MFCSLALGTYNRSYNLFMLVLTGKRSYNLFMLVLTGRKLAFLIVFQTTGNIPKNFNIVQSFVVASLSNFFFFFLISIYQTCVISTNLEYVLIFECLKPKIIRYIWVSFWLKKNKCHQLLKCARHISSSSILTLHKQSKITNCLEKNEKILYQSNYLLKYFSKILVRSQISNLNV